MFFVAKEKIGTTLGAQKEYTAAERRGIRFYSHGNVWHYLWPIDMVEQSIRERFVPAQPVAQQQDEDALHENVSSFAPPPQHVPEITHLIWSQEVGPGHTEGEPVISAFSGANWNWIEEAKTKFTEEMQRRQADQ